MRHQEYVCYLCFNFINCSLISINNAVIIKNVIKYVQRLNNTNTVAIFISTYVLLRDDVETQTEVTEA